MKSYVLDTLVKYHCFDCDKEFILSEFQVRNSHRDIVCPYCHGKDIKDYVFMDNEDDLDALGCMGIGHHENPEEEKLSYERIWGKIVELRWKNL